MESLSGLSRFDTLQPSFSPGEVAGMRSAGIILLATAVLSWLAWLAQPAGPPAAALIDSFLGFQIVRLRHSWRAWALVRAWIGVAVGIVLMALGLFGSRGAASAVIGLGQGAYAASLWLLLSGDPTIKRVWAGRFVFAASLVLTAVGIVLSLLAAAYAMPQNAAQAVAIR